MESWSGVLDSCPGLLCCVINLKGKLLYASSGYKVVAQRIFGHKCTEGSNYPPLISELDKAFHEVLTAACLGEANAIEISEPGINGKIWELTASPLRTNHKKIDGVIVRINSEVQAAAIETPAPVLQTNPDILECVPFRACVVNQKGLILAGNKFFTSSRKNLTGRNIVEVFTPLSGSSMMKIISQARGSVEGRIDDFYVDENFCDELYLAESTNKNKISHTITLKVHATPIKWNDLDCVMLTFEDVTELKHTRDQLRRILTFDTSTGMLNRRGLEHLILKNFGVAIRRGEDLSLIMININNAGDRTLRNFVDIMKKNLAGYAKSVIARWSSDEFMIMSHCSGAAAVVLANEIRDKAQPISININAGVADLATGNYAGVNDFIEAAYDAMTEAKRRKLESALLAK